MANLMADGVFLLVQGTVFGAGDVAAIVAGIEAFLRPDAAILGMKVMRLGGRDLALSAFDIDAVILMVKTGIDFGAARMAGTPAHCTG